MNTVVSGDRRQSFWSVLSSLDLNVRYVKYLYNRTNADKSVGLVDATAHLHAHNTRTGERRGAAVDDFRVHQQYDGLIILFRITCWFTHVVVDTYTYATTHFFCVHASSSTNAW